MIQFLWPFFKAHLFIVITVQKTLTNSIFGKQIRRNVIQMNGRKSF